jgi:polyisoprenoid-binding protein YceI
MKTSVLLAIVVLGMSIISCSEGEVKEAVTTNQETNNKELKLSVSYDLDAKKSVVHWSGNMVGVYGHTGDLFLSNGNILTESGVVSGGEFTVDLLTMTTTDADELYKMASREDLIGHLSSDDFFGVEKFSTASFKITGVSGNEINGELTLKGVTHSEKIENVIFSEEHGEIKASGSMVFNRQDFGVTYKNTMNDMVLSNEIELKIEITGSIR